MTKMMTSRLRDCPHFLQDIDYALNLAGDQGIADRLTVVIGSDFGRTPRYNSAQGKDHWSIGSVMVMGPGIKGNRVFGGTDEGLMPVSIDPRSLMPDAAGIRLRPEHLHQSLRAHAKLGQSPGVRLYPLKAEELSLF